jgi:WD40 repeat protein
MPVRFACPRCKAVNQFEESSRGTAVVCQQCKKPMLVPGSASTASPAAPPIPRERPAPERAEQARTDDLPPEVTPVRVRRAESRRKPTAEKTSHFGLYLGLGVGGGAFLLLAFGVFLMFALASRRAGQANQDSNDSLALTPAPDPGALPAPPELRPDAGEEPVPVPRPAEPAAGVAVNPDAPVLVLDPGGHSATVKAVLFTRDGRQIISVANDKTVRIWDVLTGETVRIFHPPTGPGFEGALYAADLSSDGQKLAVGGIPLGNGSLGNFVYVLDLASGQIEHTFTGHKDIVSSLQFSPDGKLLLSGSNDSTARLYDLATDKTLHVCTGHKGSIRRIAFAPDGRQFVTASYDKTCRIWSAATGRPVAELKPFRAYPFAVAWHPDGQTLVTGCANGTLQVWQPSGKLVRDYTVEGGGSVYYLAYNRDGRELLFTAGNRAGLFDTAKGAVKLAFTHHNNAVIHGQFSPDGAWAVTTGGNDHETYVWKTGDGSVVQTLAGKGRSVYAVGWDPTGKAIAWGNTNQGSTLQATTPLEETFLLDNLELGPPPEVGKLSRATTARDGYALQMLDPSHVAINFQGQRRHVFGTPFKGNPVLCMTMLPGNRAVIGASAGLYLVDVAQNKTVREFRGHSGMILAVAASPDGRVIVTGSTDQTLRFWNQDQEQPILSLFVTGREWIAWTPQGYYAASPYGERLMGWQINHGPRAVGSYFPAARFHPSLYQPELIRHVVSTGSFARALEAAKKNGVEGIANVESVTQVLPPQVSLTERAWQPENPRLHEAAVDAVGPHSTGFAFRNRGRRAFAFRH